MRGGKSFLILLVVAAAVGAYAYFVESKKDVSDSTTTKTEKVWTLDGDKIEQIEVKAANGDVTTLKKSGTTWQITAPKATDADQSAVSSIVSSLASLESTKTVDENPASVKPFELDPPDVSVRVNVAGEKDPREIDFGTKTPTGTDLYARVKGQPKVFLVGSFIDGQLNRTTFDLRDKTVLKFDRTKVDALELRPSGAPSVSIAKKSSDDWRLTAPAGAKADFSAVDAVLNKLSQAQMKSIVDESPAADLKKYGLDKPQVEAVVGAGSTRATLAVGAKAPDGTLYARDPTRPMVFTVEASLLDDLKKKPDDVRQKMLFDFRSYTALNLDVVHGVEALSFAKSAGAAKDKGGVGADVWKQTKPSSRDVDQTKMTDFLVDLANLKAGSFTDHPVTGGEEYVFTVRFGDEKAPQDERVTLRKSGSTVHAIRQGEPDAAVVATADFDKAITELKALTGTK